MLFFQCRNLSDLRVTVKFSPVTEKPSPRRILQALSPLGGVLTHFPQRSPSGLLPLPGTPNRVLPLCPPGVRQTRAEWDRVRGRGRGVRQEYSFHLHVIHTPHMPPIRTIGTTPSGLFMSLAFTRGSTSAVQPRASWQNPVGIPGGRCGNARCRPQRPPPFPAPPHPHPSASIRVHPRPSAPIRTHPHPSAPIRVHLRSPPLRNAKGVVS